MTISEYINKYAPAADKNDPVKYTNDMVNRFNQKIGSNIITKDTSLGELKESLNQAGLDPEHTITRAHLETEDPSVLKALDAKNNTPVQQPAVVQQKPKAATKQEPVFDPQNLFPTPSFGQPSPLIQKPETKTQPQPKVQPRVQPTIPPKTGLKKQPVVTPVQESSVLDDITSGVSGVASTVKKSVNNSYEGLKTVIKQEASNKLQSGIKGIGSMSNQLYDAITNTFGGSSEDLKNVFTAMENGASLNDLQTMAKSFVSKATGVGTEDLVGKSGSLSATKNATEVLNNWATPFNKGKENMVKKKYIVDDKQIAEAPSVVQGDYTSKAFILNLKSSKNKFGVLNNLHGGSGIKDLNSYYNNFTPVNGSMVFTAQNDVNDTRTMPLTKINEGDDWYRDFRYLMKLNNGTLEVVEAKNIKPGDNVFKTANKIFSMDDFEIKDGKINTTYDDNIKAAVPVMKKVSPQNNTKKAYPYGNQFILGLTNQYKSGLIPIDECSQYGICKGGSYVIFSEDLDQQYMVGGSFKNLYETYDKLQKQNPNKKFQIISSDTGSYSNSVFPNNGKIDGNVYRQSNYRNTYGEVQYMVLMN